MNRVGRFLAALMWRKWPEACRAPASASTALEWWCKTLEALAARRWTVEKKPADSRPRLASEIRRLAGLAQVPDHRDVLAWIVGSPAPIRQVWGASAPDIIREARFLLGDRGATADGKHQEVAYRGPIIRPKNVAKRVGKPTIEALAMACNDAKRGTPWWELRLGRVRGKGYRDDAVIVAEKMIEQGITAEETRIVAKRECVRREKLANAVKPSTDGIRRLATRVRDTREEQAEPAALAKLQREP